MSNLFFNKESVSSKLAKCRAMIASRDIKGAFDLLNHIIHDNPTHLGALIFGAKFYRDNNGNEINESFILNKLLQLKPTFRMALIRKAELAFNNGETEEALVYLNCIEVHSEQSLDLRSYAYWRAKQYDQALADINELLLIKPNDMKYLMIRCKIYRKLEDINNELTDLNTILSTQTSPIQREYIELLARRREIFYQQKNLDCELNDLNLLIENKHAINGYTLSENYMHRMNNYYATNNLDRAFKDLNSINLKILNEDDSLKVLHLGFIICYQLNKQDAALEYLNSFLNKGGKLSLELLTMRRAICQKTGNYLQQTLDEYAIYKHKLQHSNKPPSLQSICKWTIFTNESKIYTKGKVYRLHPDKIRHVLDINNITPVTLYAMRTRLNGTSNIVAKTIFDQLDDIDIERVFQRNGVSLN